MLQIIRTRLARARSDWVESQTRVTLFIWSHLVRMTPACADGAGGRAPAGAVRRLEHQRVDQDIGRDVDERRRPDDGRAGSVPGTEEDVVHALDRPGAVLGLAQVQGDDLGARGSGLQGLFMDREPQTRIALGKGKGKIGPNETGATGD